jgi:benzoate transport
MNDLRHEILNQPMRGLQIRVVIICILLAMVDGYEVLVMAFVAPHLAKAWGLGQVQVGYLLSSGIFGMALGAVFISPLADKIGRRRHILLCLCLITIGMALSAVAQDLVQMVSFRAFAGLFIGAIISSLNIIVSEYSSKKRRGTVMGLYGIGLPGGVAVGGAVTGIIIASFGWRAPFVFGAVATGTMLLLVFFALPESIEYLIAKRPARALKEYNKISVLLGYAEANALPAATASREIQLVRNALFGGVMLTRTLLLWLAYASVTASFYFANTWTAKLISDATGNPSLGGTTGVLMAVGGVIGALVFAALSTVMRPRLATVLILFAGAIAYALYANQFHSVNIALTLAVFVGMFCNAGLAAFYAISPSVYPAAARGTGVGLMIGFGRSVAILAPILTGYLLRGGWSPQEVYQLFAGVLLVAGISAVLFDRTYAGRSENPEAPEAPMDLVQSRLA